jgi:Predicted periplasmic lipoprotein (DUF2279)
LVIQGIFSGAFMRGLLLAIACLPMLIGQSAWADTADWAIDAKPLASQNDFANLKDYLNSYKIDQPDYIINPAAFALPAESGLAYAFRRIDTPGFETYSGAKFFEQAQDVWIDTTLMLAANLYFGMGSDGWGTKPFHFENEGWFGKDTYALGMDKLGHAYGGYLYSDYFTQRIAHSGGDATGAGITGAILGFGMQTVVEVLDAYSTDYGFSNGDLISDAVGAGFSMLRSTVPGLSSKLDFRMEYNPWATGSKEFKPFNDYTSQKYLLALKLSGFEQFEDTPLRFVELQAGYFARGFGPKGRPATGELRREPYVAIGFNFAELFEAPTVKHTAPAEFASRAFEVLQVPYSYAATVNK